jgi:hypothetical protein
VILSCFPIWNGWTASSEKYEVTKSATSFFWDKGYQPRLHPKSWLCGRGAPTDGSAKKEQEQKKHALTASLVGEFNRTHIRGQKS